MVNLLCLTYDDDKSPALGAGRAAIRSGVSMVLEKALLVNPSLVRTISRTAQVTTPYCTSPTSFRALISGPSKDCTLRGHIAHTTVSVSADIVGDALKARRRTE